VRRVHDFTKKDADGKREKKKKPKKVSTCTTKKEVGRARGTGQERQAQHGDSVAFQ
jgi:hypothetical protein